MIGPNIPPSSWHLDHVPTPILDAILLHLSPAPKQLATIRNLFPLSPDLKRMSMVCQGFREIILRDKILHTVFIKGHASAAKEALSSIRQDSFRYIQ
jgi:hypothetical protein